MNDRVSNLAPRKNPGNKTVPSAVVPTLQQDAYARLYGQMLAPLGLDANSFQLMMPGVTWDWQADNGFIDPAQYNFCSVIPMWSAAGTYQSTDAPFDASYGQFLNCLSPSAPPSQQQQITEAQQNVQQAQNQQNDAVTDAQVAYAKDPAVVGGIPNYVSWLLGDDGMSYQTAITTADSNLLSASNAYQSLVKACDANLAAAIKAFNDPAYSATLNNGGTSPPVPNWTLSMTSAQWVDSLAEGTESVTISYSNSQEVYDFSQSWAQGSGEISADFITLQASGSWQSADEFYTDTNLAVSITAAMTTISISPDKWFSPVTALAGGTYLANYSEFNNGNTGDAFMFGQGGVLPLVKTAMLVVFNPSITLTISSETYQSHSSEWSATGGISIGPFNIDGANGGSTVSEWTDNGTTASITINDTTGVPKILGVMVAQLITPP